MSKVDLIDHMGNDLTVVNAARVSFAKESTWDNANDAGLGSRLRDGDIRLINYLANHNHFSPFCHCFLQFRIKAPIFVARQLVKHQVGLAWNEISRRYVDDKPEFYTPTEWRKRAENKKQGSSDEILGFQPVMVWDDKWRRYSDVLDMCAKFYDELIKYGVAPEQARMVLPASLYTEWYWSGSLYAFARVCNLRLDAHAQQETREVAEQIYKCMEELFPYSTQALVNVTRTDQTS